MTQIRIVYYNGHTRRTVTVPQYTLRSFAVRAFPMRLSTTQTRLHFFQRVFCEFPTSAVHVSRVKYFVAFLSKVCTRDKIQDFYYWLAGDVVIT